MKTIRGKNKQREERTPQSLFLDASSNKKKECTTCLALRPIEEFYSKGNRRDSSCKKCVRKRKKSKYVSHRSKSEANRLTQVFELVHKAEIDDLRKHINNLDEVISLCRKKLEQ